MSKKQYLSLAALAIVLFIIVVCFAPFNGEMKPKPIIAGSGLAYKESVRTFPANLDYQNPRLARDFTNGELNNICSSGYRLAAQISKNSNVNHTNQYFVEFNLYCWNNNQSLPTLYSVDVGLVRDKQTLPLPFMFGNIELPKQSGKETSKLPAFTNMEQVLTKTESGKLIYYSFSTYGRNTSLKLSSNKSHLFEDISFADFSQKMNEVIPLLVASYKDEIKLFNKREANSSSWK